MTESQPCNSPSEPEGPIDWSANPHLPRITREDLEVAGLTLLLAFVGAVLLLGWFR